MIITFEEATHVYTINGELATTSTTQLLHKHKLAPDYSGVDEKVLKRKAEFGTKIHKDIENIINSKKGEYSPETPQGILYLDYIKKNTDGLIAEEMVGLEYSNLLSICGCIDVVGFLKNNETFIADHKTYAQMTTETKQCIAWQLSLYDYMLTRAKEINGKKINWKGAKHLFINWFKKDGTLDVIEVERIPDVEIEYLLECENSGKIYTPRELIIPKELELELINNELALAKLDITKKELEKKIEENRELLKKKMEEQNIVKWESPNGVIKVSYVGSYSRDGLDTALLKKEQPQIYKKYYKPSVVKSSVKVTTDYEKYLELEEKKNELLDI